MEHFPSSWACRESFRSITCRSTIRLCWFVSHALVPSTVLQPTIFTKRTLCRPVAFQPSKSAFPKDDKGKVALDQSTSFVDTYNVTKTLSFILLIIVKLKAMEKLVEMGKVRAVGVSNFNIQNLERILKHCKSAPTVNQVRNIQDKMFYFCWNTSFCRWNCILIYLNRIWFYFAKNIIFMVKKKVALQTANKNP